MRRIVGLALVWLAAAFTLAHANPARPLYQPSSTPVVPRQVSVDLNNTAWLGKYNAVARVFIFEPDGSLSYRANTAKGTGKIYKNRGTWKVEGNKLYFEYYTTPANKLMEFRGTVIDADTITGVAVYPLANNRADQTMKRMTAEKGVP